MMGAPCSMLGRSSAPGLAVRCQPQNISVAPCASSRCVARMGAACTQPRRAASCSQSRGRELAVSAAQTPSGRRRRFGAAAAAADGAGPAASTSTVVDDFAADSRPVILYDGVCNLCNGGVNFMLDWDRQGAYRFAALQSSAGRRLLQRCGRAPDDISSIVLVERERCFIKSEAVLRIATRLEVPLRLLGAMASPLPLPLRDALYDQIANNRYNLFGRSNACRLSDDGFASRFISV